MEFNRGYGSYTHQPLIRGILDLYNPQFILELGIGLYSTPLFQGREYLGVENNKEWINLMKTPNVLHHNLVDIGVGDTVDRLSWNQIVNIYGYYKSLAIPNIKPNLLFVDNYASCRVLAIKALRKKFDIIIFHDCEPKAVPWYSYDRLNKNGFVVYYLTSYESWTGLMVRNDKGYKTINSAVESYIKELELKDGDLNMHLIKDDNHI